MPTALIARRREDPAARRREQRQYDDRRGTSAQRGYGSKWRAYVRTFRGRYPLCGMRPPGAPQTADSTCAGSPMAVVDHIVPVTGAGDRRFDDPTNHQALCEVCHNRKRRRERDGVTPARVPATLVCGPPGAGKTAYVDAHRAPGDLVLDLDRLATALSGEPAYRTPPALLPFVWSARDAVLARLARPSALRHAWLIAGAPTRAERARYVDGYGAAVVLLARDAETCLRSIQQDARRADQWPTWREPIAAWWHAYEPDTPTEGKGTV